MQERQASDSLSVPLHHRGSAAPTSDSVRLVRVSRREHEKGIWSLGHSSLDAPAAGESSLLEQLPAAQAAALRLTVFEGLSLRADAAQLQISAMAVQRAQKKALAALRQQLVGAG